MKLAPTNAAESHSLTFAMDWVRTVSKVTSDLACCCVARDRDVVRERDVVGLVPMNIDIEYGVRKGPRPY